jgi:hypothetical protein
MQCVFGVDDPVERDAQGVVFLALGQQGAKEVFERLEFTAEQNGFGRPEAM